MRGFGDVLIEELSPREVIFIAEEPTCLKPDAKKYLAKRVRRSPLQWREAIGKELKNLISEGIIEKAPAGAVFSYISPGHWGYSVCVVT